MTAYLLVAAAQEDHGNRDCFAVAVLTHGDDSVLYGVDKTITIDNFIAPIKACPSLAGKPKIFIFQVACFTVSCTNHTLRSFGSSNDDVAFYVCVVFLDVCWPASCFGFYTSLIMCAVCAVK